MKLSAQCFLFIVTLLSGIVGCEQSAADTPALIPEFGASIDDATNCQLSLEPKLLESCSYTCEGDEKSSVRNGALITSGNQVCRSTECAYTTGIPDQASEETRNFLAYLRSVPAKQSLEAIDHAIGKRTMKVKRPDGARKVWYSPSFSGNGVSFETLIQPDGCFNFVSATVKDDFGVHHFTWGEWDETSE